MEGDTGHKVFHTQFGKLLTMQYFACVVESHLYSLLYCRPYWY